jgi:PAS domain S-box-containing protein
MDEISDKIELTDVFSVAELQLLQDLFSNATGVASIITKTDGTPVTKPSNFTKFCNEVIRKSPKGLRNCMRSDAELGKLYPNGPRIQTCLSSGLWDAGVSIVVGGKHLANWMIGQVRNEDLDQNKTISYANTIKVDPELYKSAYHDVPVMSTAKFEEVAQLLYSFANNLSEKAYRNKKLEFLILEQKKTEDQVRQSEEKYRLLVENQNDIVMEFDKNRNLLYTSPNFIKIFGKQEANDDNTIPMPEVHPEDIESTYDELKKLNTPPHTCKVIHRAMTNEGWRWYSWSNKAITNYKGDIEYIIGVGRDITERKKAEINLELSEKKYRNLVENSMVGVIQSDINLSITFANNAALKMLGANSTEDVTSLKLDSFIKNKSDKEKITKIVKTQGHIENFEITIFTLDNIERYLLISLVLSSEQIDATLIDITERKLAEKEIQHKNEQLYQSNAEKDKFFSIIAHDLRSPFNSFLGLTHIMAEEIHTMTLEQLQKIAISLCKSANNVNNLLENLLNWSRSKRNLIPFEPEYHYVKNFFSHCSDSCIDNAKNKNISIEINFPSNFKVYADKYMLETALRNIISNAIKFSESGDKVTVDVSKNEDDVVFKITDNGIGMSKKIRENLFKVDVNTTRKGTGGEPSTGLGLLLCKEFIEKHNGKIWVESAEGKGSTFYVSLPDKKI